jgi:hypothetical protein
MKKIISLSVWGNQDRYRIGALKNIDLSKTIFPEWEVFLYVDSISWIPPHYRENIHIIECGPSLNWSGLFWRFISFFDNNGYVISRDADSRLTEREKKAVDEWIGSGKTFSIVRDHIRHFDFPMLGGMWGAKSPLGKDLLEKMALYKNKGIYLSDQEFLAREVWPIAQKDSMIHDIISEGWFKNSRQTVGNRFIGQGYTSEDRPIYPAD